MTSASHRVKEELSHVRSPRRCCQLAELSALLHMDGTYRISGGGHSLATESAGVGTARKVYTLIHALFDVETPLVQVERNTPRKGKVYRVEVNDQPGFHQMMNELGVLDSSLTPELAVPRRFLKNDCCAAAALRGAFLGGGYIGEPYRPADFEICVASGDTAESFAQLFRRKSIDVGLRRRRGQWVLYLKSRTRIAEFLAITGAHHAYLEWESHAILNSTKSSVNRLVNCDSANARRLAESSLKQREMISKLRSAGLVARMEPPLAQLVEARTSYPQASLAELGQMMSPSVSKAVVQARMRRLASMVPLGEPASQQPRAPAGTRKTG